MREVANLIFEIYYAVFQGYCLQYFYGSFLEYKGQKRSWNGLYVTVSYVVIKLCVDQIRPTNFGDTGTIVNLVMTFFILVLLALLFYKAVKAITGYLVITFMAVVQISSIISLIVFDLVTVLYDLWNWHMGKGYIADVIINTVTIISLILFDGVFSVLCYHSLKMIIKSFQEKEYAVQRTELIFNLYQKNKAAEAADSTSFLRAISAKAAEKTEGMSFEEMLKSKYPGAYYNVMDTSKIDSGLWGRQDYPWDAYFKEPADDAVLDWKPTGAEPDMQSPEVHAKINSMLGKVAIVIPPELEEKMKNDPELAQKVMDRINNFILTNEASEPGTSPREWCPER